MRNQVTAALAIWLSVLTAETLAVNFEPAEVDLIDVAGSPYLRGSGTFSGEFQREDGSWAYFAVPATKLSPIGKCNETAIVDVVNSVTFEFPATAELGHIVIPAARVFLGDDLIAGRRTGKGFTYLAVQWNKLVTDETATGSIVQGTDGYAILAAAAEHLRDQGLDDGSTRCRIEYVLGFGWSQTGKLLAHMLTDRSNSGPWGQIFDGMFLGVAGGRCRSLTDEAFPWSYHNCGEPPRDHVPVVAYNTQSEIELSLGNGALRTPSEDLHIYDMAGISHIDAQFLPFATIFADLAASAGFEFMQNPVSVIPGVRATFWALYQQVAHAKRPPQSQLLTVRSVDVPPVSFIDRRGDASLLSWSGGVVHSADADGDGVADGGVRMPHMPTVFRNGRTIGGPLGTYGGIDFFFADEAGIFFANGGTFNSFSNEEISALYPRHWTYSRRVRKAVNHLVARRYLLPEDGREMNRAAAESGVGD